MEASVFLNLAFLLGLVALVRADVLWLRSVLVPALLACLAWGLLSGQVAPVAWSIALLSVNTFQLLRILGLRRPVELSDDLAEIHRSLFGTMRHREFLLFWETGSSRRVVDEQIVREGETPEALYLIVSGTVRVEKEGQTIATLSRGRFAGVLSFLSREPASADVVAEGEVVLHSWNQEKLRSLERIDADLFLKIQAILGRDLTEKMRSAYERDEEGGP